MTKGEFQQLSFSTEEPKPVESQSLSDDVPTVDDQPDSAETDGQMKIEEELERLHQEEIAEMEGSLERFRDIEISWPARGGKPERVALFDAFVSYSSGEHGENKFIQDICEQRLLGSIDQNFPKTADKVTLASGIEEIELPPLRDSLRLLNDKIEDEEEAWERLQFSGRDVDISSTISTLRKRAETVTKQIEDNEKLVTFLDNLAAEQTVREEERTRHERLKKRAAELERGKELAALDKMRRIKIEKEGRRIPLEGALEDLYLEAEIPNLPFEEEANNETKRKQVKKTLFEHLNPQEIMQLINALGLESEEAELAYQKSINITTEPTEEELEKMARANEKRKKAYRKFKALSELIY